MSKKLDDTVSLNEAVKYIMKATGRTRRQAEAMLVQAMKSGDVRVTGVPVDPVTGEEGERVPIEPAVLQERSPTRH
ncbi:MAG TPA: hypothetical protein VGG68_15005 [Caulobacteraceae bacterium]